MKVAKARRCLEPGYNQLADKPIAVDQYGLRLPFCPGKARWSEEMGELFNACLVLTETGLGPTSGGLSDQSDMLNEVLPTFLTRWRDRTYQRVWADVRDWTKTVLESVFGKKK
jgi:hypothetical protein